MTDPVFHQAYETVRARYTDEAWSALTPRQITEAIYRERRGHGGHTGTHGIAHQSEQIGQQPGWATHLPRGLIFWTLRAEYREIQPMIKDLPCTRNDKRPKPKQSQQSPS